MPVTNVRSEWVGGDLIFRDTSGNDILAIKGDGTVEIDGVTVDSSSLAVTGLTATADELNLLDGAPASISFTPAAGASNVCEVTLQVNDAAAAALSGVFNFDLWLSDASSGAGLTGTTASGAVAAKAASGIDLATYTAKKALRVQTKADGTYILSITDSSKTGFYVCAQLPTTGAAQVSAQLETGNYGA